MSKSQMSKSQKQQIARSADAVIAPRGVERVRAGHLWIYRSDVIGRPQAASGSVVRVVDKRGHFVGWAHYGAESEITLRLLSTAEAEITPDFWRGRLRAAAAWRQRVVNDTDAYRLVHAEGDYLPGLIVDRYGDSFVIQTLTRGMDALKTMWLELLIEEFKPRLIVERNDAKVRQFEGLPMVSRVLYEAGKSEPRAEIAEPTDEQPDEPAAAASPTPLPAELVMTENGIKFGVDLIGGQKTGAFLDQRENRAAAMYYGRGRALDCFSFHGSFALHLARVCERVTALDISATAIAGARRNAELNGMTNVDFVEANVFDQLREYDEQGERFSTIVLDPPAFAKNRGAVEAALRGYKEINLRALRLLEPGGLLITCSCSYHVGEDLFLQTLTEAARDAGRPVQMIEKRTQARDHPILLTVPETYYLKCVVLRVME